MRYISRLTKENGRPLRREGFLAGLSVFKVLNNLDRSNGIRMEKLIGKLDELYRRLETVGTRSRRQNVP